MVGRNASLTIGLAVAAFALLLATNTGAEDDSTRFETSRCDREEANAALDTFLSALGRRDPQAAADVFAPKPQFRWYTTTAPGQRWGTASYRRDTLLSYFRSRTKVYERISVVKSSLNYVIGPTDDLAGANGYLTRRANYLRPTRFGFKFAVVCDADQDMPPKLIVWSMARAG